MQDEAKRTLRPQDFALHYFLRPDHRDVCDLWLASGAHGFASHESGKGRNWLFMHLENLHRSGAHTACAFSRRTGGLAGFVTIDPASGWLDQIIVAQTARGSGVAALLLDEAKRMSPQRIELDVAENNQRAIHFYEREGFRKTGLAAPGEGGAKMWNMRWLGPQTPEMEH